MVEWSSGELDVSLLAGPLPDASADIDIRQSRCELAEGGVCLCHRKCSVGGDKEAEENGIRCFGTLREGEKGGLAVLRRKGETLGLSFATSFE